VQVKLNKVWAVLDAFHVFDFIETQYQSFEICKLIQPVNLFDFVVKQVQISDIL